MPTLSQQNLVGRSPVIVVMGHIDHGKSTLLDYIRKANIVSGEAGGITQHVGAYEAESVSADGKKHQYTFLDTPGHEAFCSIRERGALAADIAILVVSSEDGVKPQTIEALREIKAANIPYIVAINKIDKPNADIDRTKTSLGENEIYVEGWGGDIPCVPVSALTGAGVHDLLEVIALIAEMADLKTDPSASAGGLVIESELDARKGVCATLLVKNGKLEIGSFAVAGAAWTPIRYIEDFKGTKIEGAAASMPVVIVGWSEIPACGAAFTIVSSKKEAEKLAAANKAEAMRAAPKAASVPLATKAADQLKPSEKEGPADVFIPIAIKADVIGSLDGVKHELEKLKYDKVHLKIVSEGIGDINENDIKLAQSDPTILIVGFNVTPDKKTTAMIERSPLPLQVKTFKIIYELTEYVRQILIAKIPKKYVEEITGRAKVLAVFSKEKDRQVVGGKVQEGVLETGQAVRVMRRETEIGRGQIRELQQAKKRATEVREGFEFGMMIESKAEIAEGDKVEAVRMIEKK